MINLLLSNEKQDLILSDDSFFNRANILPGNYDEELDHRFHETLLTLNNTGVSSITLPLNLIGHYLDLNGLSFAHHVRLTENIDFKEVLIVLYGALPLDQVLRLSTLSRILLTDNVVYFNINLHSFNDISSFIKNYKAKVRRMDLFFNQIQINPTSNYNSHHSVDNEFALIQWSKYNNCFEDLPRLFKREYESNLYFKYLRSSQQLKFIDNSSDDSAKNYKFNISETKILIIDDEAKKGWMHFYKSLLSHSSINLKDLEIDFKSNTKAEIIEKAIGEVSTFNPDIVLLDLRLHDSDFVPDVSADEITGIKILKRIKSINKGIQVIVITASNKSWNYKTALKNKATDFIIKDGFSNLGIIMNELRGKIETCSKRALFLKPISDKVSRLEQLITENPLLSYEAENYEIDSNFIKKKILTCIEIAFDLLESSIEYVGRKKYTNYSYLQFFISIEELLNIKSFFQGGDRCFVNGKILVAKKDSTNPEENLYKSAIEFVGKKNKKILAHYKISSSNIRSINSTDFKMSSVLIFMFGNSTSNVMNWPSIREVRNDKAAHIDRGNVTKQEIINLIEYLIYIYDYANVNNKNRDIGLSTHIDNYDIEKLQQHGQFKIGNINKGK
jgi:CheY-like chemotaxis protein